jgi:hypothetical protein
MFGQDSKIKVAVLEERVKIHEEMVERVDAAIQTLSETNQNICKMLAVHDERIMYCARSDEDTNEKIGKLEVKVDELSKFRWMAAGVVTLAIFFTPIAVNFVSAAVNSFTQEQVKNK